MKRLFLTLASYLWLAWRLRVRRRWHNPELWEINRLLWLLQHRC